MTAGRALFERHASTISCFFRNKVADEREDLIQRTFLACVEARDRIRESSSFRAYLLRIARNVLYDHFAARARDGDPLASSVIELGESPSKILARQERDALLLHALQHLPLELQTCVELHYWEDLSIAELADVFAVAPGTVKSRLFRARELLRARLLELLAGHPERGRVLDGVDDVDAAFASWAKGLAAAMHGRLDAE
ncbi:MAG TPA: sigma-70 family RNA polymerase sigma factor [Nannocystaceae bacterium]|nr:sigma-70 family RNA polymerase sigma factor [Nannocystaceae bacterium]